MNKYFVFGVISILAIGSILTVGVGGVLSSTVLGQGQDNTSMSMDNSSMPTDHMGNMTVGIDNSTSTGSNSSTTLYN